MDHKELLKKYIKYVNDVEGINFISSGEMKCYSDVKFTDKEWSELELCIEEIKTSAVAEE